MEFNLGKIKSSSLKRNFDKDKNFHNSLFNNFKSTDSTNYDTNINFNNYSKNNHLNIKNKVLSDVEKILKSPTLNISLANNFKNVTGNNFNPENKINIKLNINSEVINNNIRINQNSDLFKKNKTIKTSAVLSPSHSQEKNTITHYKEIIKEKDQKIENLNIELQEAKKLIDRLKLKSSGSFEKVDHETLVLSKKNSQFKGINSTGYNSVSNFSKKMNQTERQKNNNIDNINQIKLKENSFEIFSDRNKNFSNSLTKSLSSIKKDNILMSGHFTTLFRQNNKIFYNKLNLSNTGSILFSPKLYENKSKPFEDLTNKTIKLIDINNTNQNILENNFENEIASNSNDIMNILNNLKNRTEKVLNSYNQITLSKN